MKFKSLKRGPKAIEYTIITQGHQALEERDVKCKENPRQSLTDALDALVAVAVKVNEHRDNKGMAVIGFEISETKHGTRSAQITYDRVLDANDQSKQFSTPKFRIEDPQSGDEGRRECSAPHAKLIETAIDEAVKYINGDREQSLLPGITDDSGRPTGDDEPESGSQGEVFGDTP